MATTQLELVTPEALLMSEPVGMVVIPGVEGDMGVMADHSPIVSTLRPGLVTIHEDAGGSATRRIFVGGGVAEVNGKRCIILAEEATELPDLNRAHVDARVEEALAAVNAATTDGERAQAKAELGIAQAQLAAVLAHG